MLNDEPRIFAPRHDGAAITDAVKLFDVAGFYCWEGVPFPDAARSEVAARAQIEDHVSVRPGTFITAFSHYAANSAGFKFNLLINGRQLFAADVRADAVASPAESALGGERLAHYLQDPVAIPSPGALAVRITNLAAAAQELQLFLTLASPVGGSIFAQGSEQQE